MRRLPREGSLADVPGIRIGHAQDLRALTGCTVILCEAGAAAGLDVRGAGAGVRDPFVCRPDHVAPRVHALLFSGGSAFGLDAAAGVMRFLRERGVGLKTSALPVPIVPAAILFDLAIGEPVFPGPRLAYTACRNASAGPVREGNVGAGAGAAVGKIGGIERATKSGLGTACVREGRLRVAALAVVNAFGDVIDPETGRILAGARTSRRGRRFAGTSRRMRAGDVPSGWARESTTLVCLATNARLDRVETGRLAAAGQNCLSRLIRPAQTIYDGDLTFALALGGIEASPARLQALAERAVERAVLRAVLAAEPAGGLPAARDLRGE